MVETEKNRPQNKTTQGMEIWEEEEEKQIKTIFKNRTISSDSDINTFQTNIAHIWWPFLCTSLKPCHLQRALLLDTLVKL